MSQRTISIIVGILIVGGAVAAYMLFSERRPADPAFSEVGGELSPEASRAVVLLNELRKFTLGEEFFQGAAWKSLKDFRVAPKEDPVGRDNPFAPAVRGL